MKTKTALYFFLVAVCVVGTQLAAGAFLPPYSSSGPSTEERLAWWSEARFGLFIHWGPVSLKGTEISWSRANSNPACPNQGAIPVDVYDNLYKEFNPVKFDAGEWVAIAKAAGMKYIVLTAKHCDGFLLWHSKANDYNIVHTPFKRDVCGELAAAAQGQACGSAGTSRRWTGAIPDFRTERNAAFLGRMQAEARELLAATAGSMCSGSIGTAATPATSETYAGQTSCSRRSSSTTGSIPSAGNTDGESFAPADYYTPEQQIGAYDDERPWESA